MQLNIQFQTTLVIYKDNKEVYRSLGELSKDFSGAEIEQVVIEAMRLGFNEDREFNNEDVLISIQNLVPLARTKSKELDILKEWSLSGNVTPASKYI